MSANTNHNKLVTALASDPVTVEYYNEHDYPESLIRLLGSELDRNIGVVWYDQEVILLYENGYDGQNRTGYVWQSSPNGWEKDVRVMVLRWLQSSGTTS